MITEITEYFDDAMSFMGEAITIKPSTQTTAIISNQGQELEANSQGNYVSMESIMLQIPKTVSISSSSVITARGKDWKIITLDNDETAWNVRAVERRSLRA
jgi:hypothetical protein